MKSRILKVDDYKWWYENFLCEDFPVNEIKPLADIMTLHLEGKYGVIIYEEGCAAVGYATIWKNKANSTYLLDYLGVPKELRNQGIGMKILSVVKKDVAKFENNENICLVLESETPNENDMSEENLLRKRRINFYERNGWVKIYEMATCGMRFNAMSFGNIPENLKQVMSEHKAIYGKRRTDVIIPLLEGEVPPLPYWMK